LADNDHTAGELVDLFTISQPAVSRHLRLLRKAGLVSVRADGKHRIYQMDPSALAEVSTWADHGRRTWEARFDALGRHLDKMKEQRDAGP
jgi:DNA-binding transcriptional ArsR family regulator